MVICIFGNTIVKPGKEDEEAKLADKLAAVLRTMPGFISSKSYTAEDGEEIGLIRFDSRESLDAWAHEGQHLRAQKIAPEIYERFWVQDVETYREYTWEQGVHTDGDLTGLFLERPVSR
jgi:antibiotic biosynthesis monooxygenase (ABM) superfamily enzyme